MSAAEQPGRRPRRGERDEQHGGHTRHHEQQVAQAQRAAVLALGAGQVAGGGKFHARPDPPSQQVQQQRHRGRHAEGEEPGREKAHGRCCRAANALRSGTPKGASVDTTS